MSGANPTAPILVVEDNDEDFYTTTRVLKRAGSQCPVQRCSSGEEALDYLFRRGSFDHAEAPGLILLDLNLPGTDGREVLREIKNEPSTRRTPVVILTTSDDPRDVTHCYDKGANSYIQKAVDLTEFQRTLTRLVEYWFEAVLMPSSVEEGPTGDA